jgi:hypothetical protein
LKKFITAIVFTKAAPFRATHPQYPRTIFIDVVNIIAAQACRILGIMPEMPKDFSIRLIAAYAIPRSDPEHPLVLFLNSQNPVIDQTVMILGIMLEMTKSSALQVKAVQSTPPSADPQCALTIFIESREVIVA